MGLAANIRRDLKFAGGLRRLLKRIKPIKLDATDLICDDFEEAVDKFADRVAIEDEDGLEEGSLLYQRMMHEIYAAQRQALLDLRNSREISSDVMRRVERELDLEESRLEV